MYLALIGKYFSTFIIFALLFSSITKDTVAQRVLKVNEDFSTQHHIQNGLFLSDMQLPVYHHPVYY